MLGEPVGAQVAVLHEGPHLLSLCLTFFVGGVAGSHSQRGGDGRSVTQGVDDLSADLLVLDLLGRDGLGGADLLGGGVADLSDQGDLLRHTVRGRGGNNS